MNNQDRIRRRANPGRRAVARLTLQYLDLVKNGRELESYPMASVVVNVASDYKEFTFLNWILGKSAEND